MTTVEDTQLTILIPAYNEGPRIGAVLDVVCGFSRDKRVVVIDDGSEDDTTEQAGKYPAEVVSLDRNLGKGAALQRGIDHVGRSLLWLFLDADLIGLRHSHMESLLGPVEEGEAAMSVGVFRGGKPAVDAAQRWVSILNGQRGLADDFVSALPDLSWSRFGVEVFLSRVAAHRGYPVSMPHLEGLSHHTKEAKLGFVPGFRYRLQMFGECLHALRTWRAHC